LIIVILDELHKGILRFKTFWVNVNGFRRRQVRDTQTLQVLFQARFGHRRARLRHRLCDRFCRRLGHGLRRGFFVAGPCRRGDGGAGLCLRSCGFLRLVAAPDDSGEQLKFCLLIHHLNIGVGLLPRDIAHAFHLTFLEYGVQIRDEPVALAERARVFQKQLGEIQQFFLLVCGIVRFDISVDFLFCHGLRGNGGAFHIGGGGDAAVKTQVARGRRGKRSGGACRGGRVFRRRRGDFLLRLHLGFLFFRRCFKWEVFENIRVGLGQLLFDNLPLAGLVDNVFGQAFQVTDRAARFLFDGLPARLDDACNLQRRALVDEVHDIRFVAAFIHPCPARLVETVVVGLQHQFESPRHDFVVGECRLAGVIGLVVVDSFHDGRGVFDAQRHKCLLVDAVVGVDDDDHFVIGFRPSAREHIVLAFEQLAVVDELVPHFGGPAERRAVFKVVGKRAGVELVDSIGSVRRIYVQGNAVIVFNGVHAGGQLVLFTVQINLEIFQVVFPGVFVAGVKRVDQVGVRMDFSVAVSDFLFIVFFPALTHQGAQVHRAGFNGQRIGGERIRLNGIDVGLEPTRKRDDQRDADNADGAGKGGQDGASLFGQQVVKRKRQRREEGHGGFFFLPFAPCRFRPRFAAFFAACEVFVGKRPAVIGDLSVFQPDDARCVLFGNLGVVRDHDNQLVCRNFFQDVDDLARRFGIQRAGRLVRKQNIGIIDQSAGNRDALHLAAGHLVRLFVQLVGKPDFAQHIFGAPFPFPFRHA